MVISFNSVSIQSYFVFVIVSFVIASALITLLIHFIPLIVFHTNNSNTIVFLSILSSPKSVFHVRSTTCSIRISSQLSFLFQYKCYYKTDFSLYENFLTIQMPVFNLIFVFQSPVSILTENLFSTCVSVFFATTFVFPMSLSL